MHITIENPNTLPLRTFPNRNDSTQPWFVKSQEALLFKNNSKYPDKMTLDLYFGSNQQDALNTPALVPGNYEITEDAFSVNQRANGLNVDMTKIQLKKA